MVDVDPARKAEFEAKAEPIIRAAKTRIDRASRRFDRDEIEWPEALLETQAAIDEMYRGLQDLLVRDAVEQVMPQVAKMIGIELPAK